jgi:MazG family protein
MTRPPPPETLPPVERLVLLLRRLLEPDGCPWDRAQDHRSLKPYLLEECHELLEAIDTGDDRAVCEELGDVLLQVVFHAEIARGAGRFDLEAVAGGIAEKVIRRHPHVFGQGAEARTPGEVEQRWDAEKRKEKRNRTSVLDGVPASLPSLRAATQLSERAARVGFDWPDAAAVRRQVSAELAELDEAVGRGDPEAIRWEIGDVLFSVANLARRLGHDAEESLREGVGRFRRRFGAMEREADESGRPLDEPPRRTIEELDAMWARAKSRG